MELGAFSQNPEELRLLEAVKNGDLNIIKNKLEGNPGLLWTRQQDNGHTLLHLAVSNNHYHVARLLLEKGANPDLADHAGWKPLTFAAENPLLLAMAELLLEFGANVDSINLRFRLSALHMCAVANFTPLAQILLENGAQIDLPDIDNETPLFKAVTEKSPDMVKLLLQYGAATNIRSAEGVRLEAAAGGDPDILGSLRSSQILRGPKVTVRERREKGKKSLMKTTQTLVARNPAPRDDQNKMLACHAFKADIVDFYIGESEQRIERSVPVYDVLYGKGADAIMQEAALGQIQQKPSFRWYHLPANNMEWVEALVRRHFAERHPRTGQYTDALTADLGMRRTHSDHHLMFTSKGSFIRPFCREVWLEPDEPGSPRTGRYIGAFMPYLHYETRKDFKSMSTTVSRAIDAWTRRRLPTRRPKPEEPGKRNSNNGSEERSSVADDAEPEENPHVGNIYDPGLLHKLLIEGYLKPEAEGDVPPLQIRRTLDHYFYSHLESTSRRDDDQVVLRYTSEFVDVKPKMFMVDQLWLWILDDDTIISCCPLRWDSWMMSPPNPATQNGLQWDVRENDPLNIHQAITGYLKKVRRESIVDVEDLSRLIASACVNAFDHYATPDEFHFFDFMENAIGLVMDKTAERFRQFRVLLDASAASNELLSAMNIKIEEETKLLVEIEDVRDELAILRRVLEDQKGVAEQLDTLLDYSTHLRDLDDPDDKSLLLTKNRVLDSHLARIERMEALTTRSIQSIRSLLKLKQQHASLSEAHSARKQAEYTSRQAHIATSYNKKVADQLDLSRKQAEETAKQGNVILLFTVVTVVFLPLSFMTSFFTIELDAFPRNGNGYMPLPTILGIILSVSAGVSIPFILLAFNFGRVLNWTNQVITRIKHSRVATGMISLVTVVVFISLALILSQPLDSGIKAGVLIAVGLLAAMGVTFVFMFHMFKAKGWFEM